MSAYSMPLKSIALLSSGEIRSRKNAMFIRIWATDPQKAGYLVIFEKPRDKGRTPANIQDFPGSPVYTVLNVRDDGNHRGLGVAH